MVHLSFCRLCDGRCGLKVEVEGGKVKGVKPDPQAPFGRGGACKKAKAWPWINNHPHRLRKPLVRKGERGEGKWSEASWGEALDLIVEKLLELKNRFGPQSISLCVGHPKGLEGAMSQRFARAFGTPNVVSSSHICHFPGDTASRLVLGGTLIVDPQGLPKTIVFWGNNFLETRYGSLSYPQLTKAIKEGAKLVVIDPRENGLSKRADLWIRVRPGGDWALILGVLKVIVEEKLYDEDFVRLWTNGFDELRAFLEAKTYEELCQLSWVQEEEMRALGRLCAQGPTVIQWGNALDHTPSSLSLFQALVVLKAILGNIDQKGGEFVTWEKPPLKPFNEFALLDLKLPPKVDSEFYLLRRNIARQSFLKAVLQEDPYPIKGALVFGSNPLLTYPEAKRTKLALEKLEFLVVADLFMTPSAALADVVLPVTANFEFEEIAPYPPYDGYSLAYPKLVEPQGEAWSDYKILNELGKRLNPQMFFEDERALLNHLLEPSGLTFEEFVKIRGFQTKVEEKGYEKKGFATSSGKAEISPKNWSFFEPLSTSEEFPLLMTSKKEFPYLHSEGRQIKPLRELSPWPEVEIHPETARSLDLKEGEWVWVESPQGRIKQKLRFNNSLDPRVIYVAYGWWFPERGETELYGWDESNLNCLTSSSPPYEPTLGSLTLRGIPCKVYKA